MHGDLAVDQRQAERRKIGESPTHWICLKIGYPEILWFIIILGFFPRLETPNWFIGFQIEGAPSSISELVGHTFTADNEEGGNAFAVAGPVSGIAFMPGQDRNRSGWPWLVVANFYPRGLWVNNSG
jgi:hypothetical protein